MTFLWLPSPEMAISRVAARVRRGGHHVDPQVVTRRYHRGLHNLFTLYLPLADEWATFDNAGPGGYQLIASREGDGPIVVADRPTWDAIRRGYA